MVDKTIIELNRSKEMFRELLAFAPTLVPITAKDGLTYFPNSYYEDWKEIKEKLNYLNAITDVDVFDFLDTLEEGISKISVYTRTEKDCLKYFPIVCDLLKDADVSMTSPVYIEITIKGSNKSSAVQAIFNVTGYDKSNTIYIGDGQNDIPIFDFLEKTYVMSNAKSYVKEHAKTVVDSVKMAIELEEESYNG